MTPTLDYRPRLDDRSRAYRVTAPAVDLGARSRYWTPGAVVTDQGEEGACVGHGVVNEWMASPVRGNPVKAFGGAPLNAQQAADQLAYRAYRDAQRIDEWEGEQYDGTSVLAGMKIGQQRGWWSGYRWAFNMTELRAALEDGPLVIGVEWREGMYEADGGALYPVGRVVGGHCILVTGYTPRRRVGTCTGPAYRLRNSWGAEWGIRGTAYIAADSLNAILFRAGGEAAVPTGRTP
jgi:Papain family cysteine protease